MIALSDKIKNELLDGIVRKFGVKVKGAAALKFDHIEIEVSETITIRFYNDGNERFKMGPFDSAKGDVIRLTGISGLIPIDISSD